MNGQPWLLNYDPPYSDDQTARYYGFLLCPFCCNTTATSERGEKIGWFASLSSITYEILEPNAPFDPLTCSRYAVSLAPLLIISPLRLVWLFTCMKYINTFRSRVKSNLATVASFTSSERASSVQIDDFAPLAHLSDSQLLEYVCVFIIHAFP
jgi:hypothetical protein